MPSVSVRFFLGDTVFAHRHWYAVPRMNEEVMLGEGDRRRAYRAIRVVWGAEPPAGEGIMGQQSVNIEIEPCE